MSGDAAPAIEVQGAFSGGGAPLGNSGTVTNNWELTNLSIYTRGKHTLKWGGRVRQSRVTDTSLNNFAGTFTFYTLAQYQQTLALQQAGYSGAQIAQLGAGPAQFSRSAGTPEATSEPDRRRPLRRRRLARASKPDPELRHALRGADQPRRSVQLGAARRDSPGAWTPRRIARRRPCCAPGFGTFYDRIPLSVTLNSLRYNGTNQQSYVILNPTFFPTVPPAAALEANQQPQLLRPVYSGIQAPRLYQASVGVERQLNQTSRLTLTWIHSRGVHLLNQRNTNAPIDGAYPAGDRSIRLLTESAGLSSLNQLVAGASVNYKKLFLFGSYTLSYGMDNNEGLPADPYNLRAEWGPSSYGDIRHRAAGGVTVPLPWKFSVSVFLLANSGQPYNITTGLDPYNTGYPAARPALLPGVAASACQAPNLKYEAGFGCFNLDPAPGTPVIGRDSARGPSAVNNALRLSRTWAFGPERNRCRRTQRTVRHGRRRTRRRPAARHVRIEPRQKIQPGAQRLHPQRAESREFRPSQRRSFLALLRAVPQPRRIDRHVARRRAQHLQSQDRSSIALHVLKTILPPLPIRMLRSIVYGSRLSACPSAIPIRCRARCCKARSTCSSCKLS